MDRVENTPTIGRIVSLRAERDLLDRLEELAREHDRTLSAEIRHACRTYLRMIDRQQSAGAGAAR